MAVAVLAPLMYSVFFLQSVWDPYGGAKKLPIAVVNLDRPTKYQGQTLRVGQETVDQLKHNHQLKWEFVSKSAAQAGMDNHRYYTVVTIPKDFSKDAATVMSKHPKKMVLHYQTNDSKNFLARSISDVGMSSLNSQIRSSVTRAYATAMFAQVHTLGKGMGQAASGAQQLGDGTMALQDGTNTYFAGVSQVNDGVQELRMGVAPLGSGAVRLVNGSAKLVAGVGQFTSGTSALAAGLHTLTANIPAINAGASQLQDGLTAYTNGTQQVAAGLGQISSQSGQLRSGAAQLQAATGQFQRLNDGSQQIAGNVANFNHVLQGSNLMETLNSAQSLGAQAAQLQSQLSTVNRTMAALQGLNGDQLNAVVSAVNSLKPSLTSHLTAIGSNAQSSAQTAASLAQQVASDPGASTASKQAASDAAHSIAGNAHATAGQIGNIQDSLTALSQAQGQLQPTLQKLQGLQAGLPMMAQTLGSAQQLLQETNQLMGKLQKNQALIQAMPGKIKDLSDATQLLSNGTAQLVQSTGSINTLSNGINRYTQAVDQAHAGAQQLTAKNRQLLDGASQLQAGWSQYAAGVQQADQGAGLLNVSAPVLNAGASQLAAGLSQLGGQVPALIAGVNQLAAGTSQLNANSGKIASGIAQLNAGAGQLYSGLTDGAQQINRVHGQGQNAQMFGTPTKLSHTSYSHVPNYGHALAPFIMGTGLFIGVLIFTLEFPSNEILSRKYNKRQLLAHEFAKAVIVSALMATVQNLVLMLMGLHVQNVGQLFAITIVYTIAQMAIMQFFTMALGRLGTIMGLLLFVAQLGGAGGMFPMEVTNRFFNLIHPFLPMTYGVNGLRQAITGGFGYNYLQTNVWILGAYALVFYILLFLIAGHGLISEDIDKLK